MEIFNNIWQVGGDGFSSPGDAAIYLVADKEKAALIDTATGHGHKQVVSNISKCLPAEVSTETLFLTHCHFDHTGGAEKLRQEYSLEIIAHELDACFLKKGDNEVTAALWYDAVFSPLKVDCKIGNNTQTFNIGETGLEAIHWPGHSPGSIILVMERDGKKNSFWTGRSRAAPSIPAFKPGRLSCFIEYSHGF